MKAIKYDQFGSADVLYSAEVPAPRVRPNQVIVDVQTTSVNVIDIRARQGLLLPLVDKSFPKTPGADVAGVVSAVGERVNTLKIGDRVFGATNPLKGEAFAEKVSLPVSALAIIPEQVSFEEAATLPIAGLAALYSVRDLGKVQRNSRVLVYGSSGGTGLFAIQLAKLFGAYVSAVCGTNGLSRCKELGADEVIDYKAGPVNLSELYDVIIDYSSKLTYHDSKKYLQPAGRFIDSSPSIPKVLASNMANFFRREKNLMLMTSARSKDLEYLGSLVQTGSLKVTISQHFPLESARQAFLLQEKGGAVGKIVVRVSHTQTHA